MQKLAANSMIIQSIGEGVKKIDRLLPGFLNDNASVKITEVVES
jgi:hypothetical protein